ncbi:MAG: (Fe-S)-binding protein [Armatimonadetes bacterium]|nr:(Fe-S)-binding protein [Armatimonadota bacterium]MBS1710841.1 (Fe-S)-binding protein [Armatimonadota bacterium]MBX3108513.1 (Fe-S)-binding protein [Fimbriimonadaceae bacterium]
MEPTRTEFLFLDGPLPKAVFYTLTFLSLGIMAWQILGSARHWMRGSKIDWRPNYLAGVAKYVLAQRKVMGSRPKEGAPLHLFIFYGFLSLLLATTLLAISTYGPLVGLPHFHKGGYYLAYETIFDALGLLYVAGIVWALRRRYRDSRELGQPIPDPATGKLSRAANPATTTWQDFAVLYLLLALGISGYLLEAARISANPQPWDGASFVGYGLAQILPKLTPTGYQVIWWQHMVWVWLFFATLPQMRLKHIVVATLAAAGTAERPMGRLPETSPAKLETGEPIGAAAATDLSRWHLLTLDACMSCGRCTEVCPAHNVGKSLNPKQVVQDSHRALRTGIPLADAISEDALWACTTCNACVEACPVLIRHVDIIVESRRHLVEAGRLTGSAVLPLKQAAGTGSAWGQNPAEREQWMAGLGIPLAREGTPFDILFWVGCAGATDPAAIRTTRAFAQLMQKAGVAFACLGQEESCTGDPMRRIGDEAAFLHQQGINAQAFQKYGVRRVVTACPHCLNTLKNEYEQRGERPLEVLHHTELLSQLVTEGRLKSANPAQGQVTYHDPCYLARVNNVSDAPRSLVGQKSDLDSDIPLLLREITTEQAHAQILAEPGNRGRKTLCCGAGGGRMWMEEEPSQRPSERRAGELLATGATTIAVGCPFCRIMLDAGIKQVTDEPINLVDLAELLHEANR